MGEAAISVSRNSGKQLRPYQFRPGQTGNPNGRPRNTGTTLTTLKALARENIEKAIKRLGQLIDSQDDAVALQAVQFTFLYGFGKPMDGHDVVHLEKLEARHQELTVTQEPELPATVPPEVRLPNLPEPTSVQHEASTPAPVLTSPTLTEAPLGVSVEREPSGLRCLFHTKTGQCSELADNGHQWCKPHMAKLFESIK